MCRRGPRRTGAPGRGVATGGDQAGVIGGALIVLGSVGVGGLTQVVPGHARVVQLFGRYTGTVRHTGLRCVNPFARRLRVAHRRDRRPGRCRRVRVLESRITRLAFAPEIAQAMLRRQQADAVVAARQRIVEGAVGMVELALDTLEEKDVVDLDQERRATMVSNLLVVLCSEQATQPVVNAGSLYH